MTRRLLAISALLFLAAPAWAGDPVEDARVAEAENLEQKLAAWGEAGNKKEVERALPRWVKSHNELQTKKTRAKLQKVGARLLGVESLGGVRLSVADAFGRLNDPKGVWSNLKRHMPAVKDETVPLLHLRVVQAVGAVAPDVAIPTLTTLMEKAKDNNAARYAVQALGKYGWSKRREKVLASVLETLRKMRPGGRPGVKGKGGGQAARARYAFLERTMLVALGDLTGQKQYDTADKWLAAHKAFKKKLGKLFTFER